MLPLTRAGQNPATARRVMCLQAKLRSLQVPGGRWTHEAGSKDVIRSKGAIRKTLVFHKLANAAGLENSDGSIILSDSQGLGEAS
jgi:hypothetical protein